MALPGKKKIVKRPVKKQEPVKRDPKWIPEPPFFPESPGSPYIAVDQEPTGGPNIEDWAFPDTSLNELIDLPKALRESPGGP